MNQQQREQALRLASALDGDANTMRLAGQNDSVVEDMGKAGALLHSLAEEPQADPVYWVVKNIYPREFQDPDLEVFETRQEAEDLANAFNSTYTIFPVYVASNPAAKQERLTDEQINEAWKPWMRGTDVARAIESACAKAWGVKL